MHPARFTIIVSLALGVQFVASGVGFSGPASVTPAKPLSAKVAVQGGEHWLFQAPGDQSRRWDYADTQHAGVPDEQRACVEIPDHRIALGQPSGSASPDKPRPLIY